MQWMWAILGLVGTASADPVLVEVGAPLAPGPRELGDAQAELEQRLVVAEAIQRAVSRLQSAYSSTPPLDDVCRDPLRGPFAVKLRYFAQAWHDAAQRVRVQADRVARVSLAETVAPIVDPERRSQLDSLLARSRAQESGWLELVAWVRKQMPEDCIIDLIPSPGLADPIIRGNGEKVGPVALIAESPGFVCTEGAKDGVAADGRVMIVSSAACWSPERFCGCAPMPVTPGAVLGP